MIIGDLNVERIARSPSKTNAVLIIDADAVLPRTISLQRLKAVRGRRRKVSELLRAVNLNQSPERDRGDRLKSPHAALPENRLRHTTQCVKRSARDGVS